MVCSRIHKGASVGAGFSPQPNNMLIPPIEINRWFTFNGLLGVARASLDWKPAPTLALSGWDWTPLYQTVAHVLVDSFTLKLLILHQTAAAIIQYSGSVVPFLYSVAQHCQRSTFHNSYAYISLALAQCWQMYTFHNLASIKPVVKDGLKSVGPYWPCHYYCCIVLMSGTQHSLTGVAITLALCVPGNVVLLSISATNLVLFVYTSKWYVMIYNPAIQRHHEDDGVPSIYAVSDNLIVVIYSFVFIMILVSHLHALQ